MPTIEDLNELLIALADTEPTSEDLENARDLADELYEAACSEDTETAREKALLIIGLLWPATS